MKKFSVIWQSKTPHEFDWIEEIFGNLIKEHVYDGAHEVVCDDAILIDAFIHRFDAAYYRRFEGKNAFLVHVLDETYAGGYERYLNFKGVFRGHFSAGFNTDKVMNIPLGYYKRRSSARPLKTALQRPYIWSFVGDVNKSTRPDVLRALVSSSPFLVMATSSVYGEAQGTREKVALDTDEYYRVIEDSVFSPTPMGNVNIECYRAYEALEAGSIPIVEKRLFYDYFQEVLGKSPIPVVSSWTSAAKMIERLITRPSELEALQRDCTEFWRVYKEDLKARIGDFIERNAALPGGGRMYSPVMNSRVYSYLELLRHHNVSALIRRVRRQFLRLRVDKRWRISH